MYSSTHSVSHGVCGFQTSVGDGFPMPLLALPFLFFSFAAAAAATPLPYHRNPFAIFFFAHFFLCFLSWWPIRVLLSSRACPVHHKTFSGPELFMLLLLLLPLQCQSTCDVRSECYVETANLFMFCTYFVFYLSVLQVGCLVSHVTWGQCSLLLLYSI